MLSESEVIEILRKKVGEAGSQSQFAFIHNLDRSLLCNILSKKRALTCEVAGAAGYSRIGNGYVRNDEAAT